VYYSIFASPIGDMVLTGDGSALSGLDFVDSCAEPSGQRDDGAFGEAKDQLRAYFGGELTEFNLELGLRGTPFQQRVWSALRAIPYGTTTTYGTLATALGDARATRAVGSANGRNPISIIIPCHRVIGANGGLTGYGGGMERKRWLLSLEGRALAFVRD
jgi:methylated-DNA-[protein]-cysteine S-methyltransferase